jgi:hypothetical protein
VISRASLPRPALLLCALLATLVVLGGCGGGSGSGGGGDTDPATAVAPGAPVYAEAVVHPDGKLAGEFDAVASKILNTSDPGAKIKRLIDDAGRENGLQYKQDIEPWLGDRVGAAITSLADARSPRYLVVAASKDDDAARKAIERDERGDKVTTGTYAGVAYRDDRDDDTVTGVTDGLVLLAPDLATFRRAVDTLKGDSLAEAKNFKDARAKVAQDRLAFFYADPNALFSAVTSAAGPAASQLAPLRSAILGSKLRSLAAALTVDPDAIRLDAAALGGSTGKVGAAAPSTLAQLPGDAWFGAGLGDIGGALNRLLVKAGSFGGALGLDLPTVLRQVKQQTGIDLRKDLLDWMGRGGIFVEGTTVKDLGGALVVETKDPAATRRGISRIARLLRRSGQEVRVIDVPGADLAVSLRPVKKAHDVEVVLATGGHRFTAGVGRDAAADALRPSGRLADAPAFKAGAAKLTSGVQPSLFLDFTTVVKLLQSSVGDDKDFQRAKPYLDAFTQLVAGGHDEADGSRVQVVVGVR